MNPIAYSRGRSISDNRPGQFEAENFASFVQAIDADRAPRKDGAGYICGPLNGDGRRCAEGAMPRRWLAVDLDRIAAAVLPEVRLWFAGRFSGCGWPTHSSTESAPRERVLIELSRDARRDECIGIGRVLMRDLADEFGDAIFVDASTFRPEQPIYLPPTGIKLAMFLGDPLDADAYVQAAAELPRDDPPASGGKAADEAGTVEAIRRGENLHENIGRLTASWAARGMGPEAIEAAAHGLLETARPMRGARVDEFARDELGRLIDGALHKFAPKAANEKVAIWTVPPPIAPAEQEAAHLAPRCIVENYLFADVATLIAPGSTGKTTTTLFEAIHIALGLPLWGLRVLNPGPVLIVTAEDRREYLVARLREILAALRLPPEQVAQVREQVRIDDCTTDRRRLTMIVGDVVMASDFADLIVAGCRAANFMPALVQFDPLVSFGVGEARTNDAEQGLVEAARIVTAGLDCCTRYTHHTGKAGARDRMVDQYVGRGGSALADGCRMVHVMQGLDEADLMKATGERLAPEQSAFTIDRPKLSYAPPQRQSIYVRRTGYAFEVLRPIAAQSDDDRRRAIGEQLARFIEAEYRDGRRHTRNTLETLRPESLSRPDVRAGLAWLGSGGRLYTEPVIGPDGKAPAKGARECLRAIAESGEPTARRAA